MTLELSEELPVCLVVPRFVSPNSYTGVNYEQFPRATCAYFTGSQRRRLRRPCYGCSGCYGNWDQLSHDCKEPLLNGPGTVRAPLLACMMFQVLWEACQQKTGEHKTMLQMILCNKSYQQLWLGNHESGFFSDTYLAV